MPESPEMVGFRPLSRRALPPLAGYGLVGDGRSAALVSSEGSVDWWCPRRFDSSSVFARLLDRERGGHFAMGLPVRHKTEVMYERDTNVLVSRFVTSDVDVRLTTFMPHLAAGGPEGPPPRIVRLVECVRERDEVDVSVEFAPRFDYARTRPAFEAVDGGVLARTEEETLALASTIPLEADDEGACGTVRMREGERHALVLDLAPGPVEDPAVVAEGALEETRRFWREWADRCTYQGRWRDEVVRSLLALKLMQHEETGSFVAAPTCSLPEELGGERNWDYRYAWLRDGVFIVMALEEAGYEEETRRFKEWLARVARRDAPDHVQMLYRVDGSRNLEETKLDHLAGYRGSRPVRVGNEAAEQRQLDTYGEVLMCFPLAEDLFKGDEGAENWRAVRGIVDWVCDHWREPDSGLWELRGRRRQYVYSKAMAWAALDHGLRASENFDLDAPHDRWRRVQRDIRDFILKHGYDEGFGSFTQATDRPDADASNLVLPLVGFLPADDPRMVATTDRALKDLVAHGLVHRYIVNDELPGSEGAFLVGSFWLAFALTEQGRLDDARAVFERALDVAGPLGLLAEEADPVSSEMLGNHPQALSHLGLVLAALRLDEALGDGERQSAFSEG